MRVSNFHVYAPLVATMIALLSSTPAAAQAAIDPRPCLYDETPPAERARRVAIEAGSAGWQYKLDDLNKEAVDRCIAAKGWSSASASAILAVISAERDALKIDKVVRPMGFTLDWIDDYLRSLDPRERDKITPYSPGGRYFTKTQWPPIAGRFGRPIETEADKAALWKYIGYRRVLADRLRDFSAVAVTKEGTFLNRGWQMLPAIEANRPVFTPRALTKDERSELLSLAKVYLNSAKTGSTTVSQMQRLKQLGETGDKAAMIIARDALAKGPPGELLSYYSDMRVDASALRETTSILAAIWTAHIWQRHGYDDASRKYMVPCIGGIGATERYKAKEVRAILRFDGTVTGINDNGETVDDPSEACGFILTGKLKSAGPANGATVLESYDHLTNRRTERDFFITGARFNPVMGDAAFLEAKFQNHLRQRGAGLLLERDGDPVVLTPSLRISLPWYEKYASDTGRSGQLRDADASRSAKLREARTQARANAEKTWAQAVASFNANSAALDRVDKLKSVASDLGLEYWGRFTKLVPNWDARTTSAANGAYGNGLASAAERVQVRTYDQNGNYTGSTTTSAAWADIMKMTSGPPR